MFLKTLHGADRNAVRRADHGIKVRGLRENSLHTPVSGFCGEFRDLRPLRRDLNSSLRCRLTDSVEALLSDSDILLQHPDIGQLSSSGRKHVLCERTPRPVIVVVNAGISAQLLSHNYNGDRHIFQDLPVLSREDSGDKNHAVHTVVGKNTKKFQFLFRIVISRRKKHFISARIERRSDPGHNA